MISIIPPPPPNTPPANLRPLPKITKTHILLLIFLGLIIVGSITGMIYYIIETDF